MTTAPLRLAGMPASPGLACGPLHLLDEDLQSRGREHGSPFEEERCLREALLAAATELGELIERSVDIDEKAILEFQIAMLEDETLTAPVFEAIGRALGAGDAWRAALDVEIKSYVEAEDAYFQARATDLRDVRDRVLRCLSGTSAAAVPAGAIVIAADLAPSRFLEIAWQGGGIALFDGSPHSHVATLARARGVPMIVGMTRATLAAHDVVLLDAERGFLIASPDREASDAFERRRRAAQVSALADRAFITAPAVTASGERIEVLLNVAHPGELAGLEPAHCDGIGLVRTELVLRTIPDLADEERQFEQYLRIVAWAQGKPVTFRTLDAGGDKPIDGYTIASERNPFLGMRGVRLSLLHADLFEAQLRALARVAAIGEVKILVPMVTRPWELRKVRVLLQKAVDDVRRTGVPCAAPKLGMMVEVPAAALAIDEFEADFFSIGSNDLIQYVTACSRDSDRLATLTEPLQPAILRLIGSVADFGRRNKIEVSLCGDMASEPRTLRALLALGLRRFSIAPAALGPVKATIARFDGSRVA